MSEALDVLSALVLEDGRRWGEAAAEFQWEDARAVLDREARPNHFLTRARGGSKTSDLAGMAIAVGLTQSPPHTRMYGLAAARDQAALLLDSVAGFYSRTPELQGTLTVREHKVYFHATNSMLHILPADQATLWGLRPYFVIVDEIGQWHTTPPPQRCYEAVSTAAAKMADSRMVLLTTASDPAHWSYRVIQAARDDPLWRVHEVHGAPPWMNDQRLEGERRRLPESSFRRLFLNEWAAGEDRLATEEDLIAACRLDGYQEPERGKRYVIGLDVGLTADATVACVCHAEREEGHEHPTVVLDRMQVWHGSLKQPVQLQQVEDWIEEAAGRYNRASVRFDPYQAVHLAQRLKKKGLHVSEFVFSASSVGKLANVLLQLIREHSLAIPEEPELLDELRNVRLKESSPNVYRIDHDRFQHDDRVIALALAANWLAERPSARGRTYSSFKIRRARVMEQLDLFRPDMAEARRQADAAIERAYNGADPEWKAAAAWAVFYVAKNKRVFTGDDIWAVGLPRPREPRALGPIMLRAAKKGLIRKTGRMVPSAVPKDHMNPHYEWESLIFE